MTLSQFPGGGIGQGGQFVLCEDEIAVRPHDPVCQQIGIVGIEDHLGVFHFFQHLDDIQPKSQSQESP